MRLLLAGFLLGLFALDIALDSYDLDCPGAHASVSCCADACGSHVVPQKVVQVALVSVRAEFIPHELVLYASPPPKSLLRPPCLAA